MYKIYLYDNVVIITTDGSAFGGGELVRVAHEPEIIERTKLLQKLRKTKQLVLISPDPQAVYAELVSQFRVIEASGGLAVNRRGEVLMIFRLGKWDLPKGKVEPGEDIRECALRETAEECGVNGLSIVRELEASAHIYSIGDEFVLKHTRWFEMSCGFTGVPTPQTEEDITKAEWVSQEHIAGRLANSYPAVVELITDYLSRSRIKLQ